LILTLMAENASSSASLYTTTTRIMSPPLEAGASVIAASCEAHLQRITIDAGRKMRARRPQIVAAKLTERPGYLSAVQTDFVNDGIREFFPLILNEADGARGMSLKFPREGEPVMMEGGEYLVAVIGYDCFNQPIGPESVFRWDICARELGLRAGGVLTPEIAASILLHQRGVCRNWNPGMKLIVFINKVDDPAQDPAAAEFAQHLLSNCDFRVDRVVWGSLRKSRAASIGA
jgi:probable selenium-dependent hydroxylase accessory protein YqeC